MTEYENVLEELAEELGGYGSFGGEGDSLNLEQAEMLDSVNPLIPNAWRHSYLGAKHDTAVEAARDIKNRWSGVKIRFSGEIEDNESAFITEMVVDFENVEDKDNFKFWMEKKFCSSISNARYIGSNTDGVNFDGSGERVPADDPSLWATTDEFQFRDKYCRLWWDD
jgi:hypothetical protein